MTTFSVPVTLPSGKVLRVPELSNKVFLSIGKFCENSDYEGLNDLLIEFLKIPSHLDIIDRLYLFIFYRMLFIGDKITFVDKQSRSIDYDINLILEKISKIVKPEPQLIVDKRITVEVGIPNSIFFANLSQAAIHYISYNDKKIDFQNLSIAEQEDILNKLPQSTLNLINNYSNRLAADTSGIILIEENKSFNIEEIKIDLLTRDSMVFVGILYAINLVDFFQTLYGYVTKISADSEFYYNLSPIESKIILNIHNKEIEKENNELKKQQQRQ